MAKRSVPDEFVNIVYATVDESAANTLTRQKLETGYGSLQKTAWIISRIEWYLTAAAIGQLAANDDIIQLALVTSDVPGDLDLADASLVDLLELSSEFQTAVGFRRNIMPIARDFSRLAGGGRLVLPYPLFIAVKGTSLAAAITGSACRIFFTERELADNEWMELVQQTRLLS